MDFSPSVLYCCIELDLYKSVAIDGGGTLPPNFESDPRRFASRHLLGSIVKKYQANDPKTASLRATRAVDKFLAVNEACRTYNYDQAMAEVPSWVEMCANEAILQIENLLQDRSQMPRVSWWNVYKSGYFGPGSSIGPESTDAYTKYTTTLGCSSQFVADLWASDCKLAGLCNSPLGAIESTRRDNGEQLELDDRISISTVLKNAEIDRTIGTEPSINGYYQLGLGSVLASLLKYHWGIDLSNQQSVNRVLARAGSATGEFGTMDLTSASDSVAVNLCNRIFPGWFHRMLLRLRTPRARINVPSFKGEKTHTLYMISSMGNGFTFPLQTIIFGSVVRAAYKLVGITPRGGDTDNPNYGINGDDIICHHTAFNLVKAVLEAWGFTVNSTKSFNEGWFRESCGGDFYRGYFVRGVYAQRVETQQDVVSLVNRLIVWSARWDIPLRESCQYLLSLVRFLPLVPPWEADDAGLKVPVERIPDFIGDTQIYVDRRERRFYKASRWLIPILAIDEDTQGTLLYQAWVPLAPKAWVDPYGERPLNAAALMQLGISGHLQYGRRVIPIEFHGKRAQVAYDAFYSTLRLPQGTPPTYRLRQRYAPGWVRVIDGLEDSSIPPVGDARWSRAFNTCIS